MGEERRKNYINTFFIHFKEFKTGWFILVALFVGIAYFVRAHDFIQTIPILKIAMENQETKIALQDTRIAVVENSIKNIDENVRWIRNNIKK